MKRKWWLATLVLVPIGWFVYSGFYPRWYRTCRSLATKNSIASDECSRFGELYRKYGTMKDVSEATGLPAIEVSRFVKFSRLAPPLKKLVEDGLDLRVALNAQDVAAPDGGKLTSTQATEAVKLAKEMATMTGAQRTKLTQERAAP